MNGLESGLFLLHIFIFWISSPSVTIKFDDTVSDYYLLFTFLIREIIIYYAIKFLSDGIQRSSVS